MNKRFGNFDTSNRLNIHAKAFGHKKRFMDHLHELNKRDWEPLIVDTKTKMKTKFPEYHHKTIDNLSDQDIQDIVFVFQEFMTPLTTIQKIQLRNRLTPLLFHNVTDEKIDLIKYILTMYGSM